MKEKVKPSFVEFGDQGGDWTGGGYRVRALPVQHTVPALGYAITDSNGTALGYTGDTAHCPNVEQLASTSSVLVLDTTFPTEGKLGHMGLDEVQALARSHPDLQLLSTHLSDDVPAPTEPNLRFPADGQGFTIDTTGLHTTGRTTGAPQTQTAQAS
jgi:ribonuclease BN (tRNA processing enzyme)